MLLELKANCSQVPCTSGSGEYGYAVIILSPTTYATLAPMTPFAIPIHLDILHVPLDATQYKIVRAKTQHDETLRQFSEYNLIQQVLIQQVLEIVEGKFLTLLQSRVTGQVPTNIRQLINSLFATYVENSVNKLKEKYNVVVAMSYCVTHRHYL